MSYCCVSYDAAPNKFFEIQKEDPKYLTTADILKKINSDNNNNNNGEAEKDISSFLWYRTSRCATVLKDDDYPLLNYPSLVLSNKPDFYETLPQSLQVYTSLPSTEIQNNYPGYSIFYIGIKHTTEHNIPNIFLPVAGKKMSRSSLELNDIINESFAILGTVDTKAIYDGNGNKYTNLDSIHKVFDELQRLDKNQNDIQNNKKKKNNELEEATKLNVMAEVEFSEIAQQKLSQRSALSEEIVNTELEYLDDLNKLDQFWQPKLKEESLLTEEELTYIFKDIKTISTTHQKLLQALEKAKNGYASEFGRLFLTFAPFLRVSSDYISKYTLINEMIKKKEKESEKFTEKIDEFTKEGKLNKDLTGYLIAPVKRFPYYVNFLKNLIKITPKNHPDALFLPIAKKELSDLVTQLEEKQDSTTKSAILMNIQISNGDGFDYVTPQRKLIQSFPVSYIHNQSLSTNSNKQNKEPQEKSGIFHICNDYTFLVDKETSKCVYKCPLLTFHYLLSSNPNTITLSTIKDDHSNNGNQCITKSNDVQFQNDSDQNNFFSLIDPQAEQKAENIAPQSHSLLWKAKKTNTQLNPVSYHKSIFNGSEHVFFGGCAAPNNDQYYSNLVLLNGDDVTEKESGINGRRFHSFTNVNNKLFVIGGQTASENNSDNILVYDGEHQGWTAISCPEISHLIGHTAVPLGKDEIIIYGGIPSHDEIFSLNTTTYEINQLPIKPDQNKDQHQLPDNRYCHSAVIYKNKMIIYGGVSTETNEILSDMWTYDLDQHNWELIKWNWLERSSHSALLIGNEMVVIGGEGSNQSLSVNLDDKDYNVKFIEEYGNVPPALIGSAASYDPSNKNIAVYGGCESSGGPSMPALYELQMDQKWKDSINNDQEIVERDIVTDLNPNFIEVDENGNVNVVPSPEEAGNEANANEEEEIEVEIEVEMEEEDKGEENQHEEEGNELNNGNEEETVGNENDSLNRDLNQDENNNDAENPEEEENYINAENPEEEDTNNNNVENPEEEDTINNNAENPEEEDINNNTENARNPEEEEESIENIKNPEEEENNDAEGNGEEETNENINDTDNIDENENLNDIEDFNYSDKLDDVEGGDNQNGPVDPNDIDLDQIIVDINNDAKNDEKLDEELRDFSNNYEPDQDGNQEQKNEEEDNEDKLLTEPGEEEEENNDLLDENQEEEDNLQSNPQDRKSVV